MTALSSMRGRWQWLLLLILSTGLAWLLHHAGFAGALLLGPMIIGICFGLAGATVRPKRWTIVAAQSVIGCLVASTVTASIVATIAADWLFMVLAVFTTVLAGAIVGWVLVKLKALPGTTAAWGFSPGAASAMVLMSGEFGADVRLVAFTQYLRVFLVVFTASLVARLFGGPGLGVGVDGTEAGGLPLLPSLIGLAETLAIAGIGGTIGWRLRIPAGAMLVPTVVGSILQVSKVVTMTMPDWLLGIAYAAIGWHVGLTFNREVAVHAMRAVPKLLVATLALIGLCAGFAWVLTGLLAVDPLTAYLATTPGGLDSVAIIAVGSGVDIPFVLALQTLRLFVVVVTGPLLARLISRYA